MLNSQDNDPTLAKASAPDLAEVVRNLGEATLLDLIESTDPEIIRNLGEATLWDLIQAACGETRSIEL